LTIFVFVFVTENQTAWDNVRTISQILSFLNRDNITSPLI